MSWKIDRDLIHMGRSPIATVWAKEHISLIAAAPDLYEALREIFDLEAGEAIGTEYKEALYAWKRKARAALAKARGEQE